MKDPQRFLVYAYLCPDSHQLRYVGKGARSRATIHWARATKGVSVQNPRFEDWLKKLIVEGKSPIIVRLAEKLNEDEALLMEAQLILKNGIKGKDPRGKLLNMKKEGLKRFGLERNS